LSVAKATKSLRVLIEHAEGIGGLLQPEVQVGGLPGELMHVRVRETLKLTRK
jgi:hypothetical protein